jgi:integrase
MLFSFARVSAVLGIRVSDFYENGRRRWFRLLEKGGKHHEVPVHHKAKDYVAEYHTA